MKNFLNFLNSGAGLLILGFVVTTGVGSILNYLIQTEESNNERWFEMYFLTTFPASFWLIPMALKRNL